MVLLLDESAQARAILIELLEQDADIISRIKDSQVLSAVEASYGHIKGIFKDEPAIVPAVYVKNCLRVIIIDSSYYVFLPRNNTEEHGNRPRIILEKKGRSG